MACETFLVELFRRLKAARRTERELDRKYAHRFNIFRYLRQDERGLSRAIADLLNPKARHGQGTLFLSALLELDGVKEVVAWPTLDSCRVDVTVERETTAGRRIDISVEIVDAEEARFCLAIENKPYASDQPRQILDYLNFLGCKYQDRFLLVYLSATGDGPSEQSIDMRDLLERKRGFSIMAYSASAVSRRDEFNKFRIPCTLTDWLRACRNLCDVDRLRWFLEDMEKFCEQTFGDLTMSSDIQSRAILESVLSDRRNLECAFAVYQSWPLVRDDVCKRYLENLCVHIRVAVREDESLKKFVDGLCVECTYGGETQYGSSIFLYRKSWAKYSMEGSSGTLGTSCTRTTIAMNNAGAGPSRWGAGVASPIFLSEMRDDDDRKRRKRLEERFGREQRTDAWPWWELLDERKGDWSSRIPDLHDECERGTENDEHGLTAYFVGEFISIARRAMPIVDDIEGREVQANA